LISGILVKPIAKPQYDEFRTVYEPLIFPNRFDISAQAALSDAEKSALDKLGQNLSGLYDLRLGFFNGDEMIGWSYGIQMNAETFRMVTTGILPEFQGKGIYSSFLKVYAEHIKKQGFQILFSRHYATNNQVIVPKLRFGFVVSGFEISDQFGLLLHVSYFFNKTREKVMHTRSGLQQPDAEVSKMIRKYD
jgi:hypothetical protein